VVPLFFSGQNSWRFHAVSQFSMFLRMSLIVPEALRHVGRSIDVRVGETIPYEQMSGITNRNELTAMLRRRVFALCPDEVFADRVGRIRAFDNARSSGKFRAKPANLSSSDRKVAGRKAASSSAIIAEDPVRWPARR
jgi:hypothetical protein